MLTALAAPVALALSAATDPVPDDNDVVAGWGAFALFGLLILAVVVLGVSLTRRLKNADRAEQMGLYDPSERTEHDRVRRSGLPSDHPTDTPRGPRRLDGT